MGKEQREQETDEDVRTEGTEDHFAGGTVALVGGEYFEGKHDTRNRRLASNGRMNCQTLPELRDTLCEAGYSNTEIHEEWNKGWFCVVGRKPVVDTEESLRPT